MKRFTTLAGAIGLTITACAPTAPQFTAQDSATIRGIFDATVKSMRAGDFPAWAAEFSDSAAFYAPNAPPVVGRPAILAYGKAMPPIEEFSFSNVQVSGEGNLAFGTSAVVLKLKGIPADSSKQLVVFRRSNGGSWQVVAGAFNSNLPAPPPPAPGARR